MRRSVRKCAGIRAWCCLARTWPSTAHLQATKGLLEEFGGARVKDAPIAEQAIVGTAIGAAATAFVPSRKSCTVTFAGGLP